MFWVLMKVFGYRTRTWSCRSADCARVLATAQTQRSIQIADLIYPVRSIVLEE
jgi:hypothetical protein